MFYLHFQGLNSRRVFVVWAATVLIAAASRRKDLWFLAWFALLAPLPIMFIPNRGFFVMYFPMAAWAMFIAVAMVWIRDLLVRYVWKWPIAEFRMGASRIAPSMIAIGMVLAGLYDPIFQSTGVEPLSHPIEQMKEDFMRLNEPLPRGAHILLLHSRFSQESQHWYPLMIAQLLYADSTLVLGQAAAMNPPPDPAALSNYDCVMGFEDDRLIVVHRHASKPVSPSMVPRTAPRFSGVF
jgi:hypothetical protein